MELAILLSRDESAIVEHGEAGETEYDNMIDRITRYADKIDSNKGIRVLGLDEDNELYEVVIPSDD